MLEHYGNDLKEIEVKQQNEQKLEGQRNYYLESFRQLKRPDFKADENHDNSFHTLLCELNVLAEHSYARDELLFQAIQENKLLLQRTHMALNTKSCADVWLGRMKASHMRTLQSLLGC